MKRISETIVTEAERYSASNSSELLVKISKPIGFFEKFELKGGATAITDDIVLTRKGKNLIDGNLRATPKTQNGVTIQYLPDEDCYLLNGTCTNTVYLHSLSHTILVDDYITVSAYYVSGAVNIPSGYAIFFVGGKDTPDGSTSNWQSTDNFNIGGNTSATSNTSKKYISKTWFYISKGITFDNYKVRIMVEKGKVQSPAYEPYFNKTITFSRDYLLSLKNVNNLFDKDTFYATQTKSGITWTNNGDGTITANGTATQESYYNIGPALSHGLIDGHKVLIRGCPQHNTEYSFELGLLNQSISDRGNGAIGRIDGSRGLSWGVAWKGTPTFDNLVFKPELYDLTAIYGEGNEPTTVDQFLKTYPLSSADKLIITRDYVKYNGSDITDHVTGLDSFFKIINGIYTINTTANIVLSEFIENVSYRIKSLRRAFYTGEKTIYSSELFMK